MSKGFYNTPIPHNEPVKSYLPKSPERKELRKAIDSLRSQVIDIPMYIGGKEVRSDDKRTISPPHDHKHIIANYHKGDHSHVELAINAALAAKPAWEALPWEQRASIFLKAADLIAGPYRVLRTVKDGDDVKSKKKKVENK